MIMVLQREMKARLMQIGKEELEIMYLGVSVVYEGEYYFKKMRVKLAQWSGYYSISYAITYSNFLKYECNTGTYE